MYIKNPHYFSRILLGGALCLHLACHTKIVNLEKKADELAGQADTLLAVSRYKQAVEKLELAAHLSPNDARIQLRLARAYYHAGKRQEAIDILNKLLQRTPPMVEAYVFLGEIYIDLERWEGARDTFRSVLALSPNDPSALYRLAQAELQLRQKEQAKAHLLSALKIKPKSQVVHALLGQVYAAEGLLKKAEDFLIQAVNLPLDNVAPLPAAEWEYARTFVSSLKPGTPLAFTAQDFPYLAAIAEYFYKQKDFERALATLENSLRMAEGTVGAPGKEELMAQAAKFRRGQREVGTMCFVLGTLYFQQGQDARAREYLEQAAKLLPASAAVHAYLGPLYYRAGDWERSVGALKRAVAARTDDSMSYFYLGKAYFKLKKQQDAKQTFQAAVRLDPNYEAAHYFLGVIHLEEGAFILAEREANKALQLNKKDSKNIELLAKIFAAQEREEDTQDMYRRLLELEPNNAEALYQLAKLDLEDRGSLDSAEELAAKAVVLAPDNSRYMALLAEYRFKKGDLAQAIRFMRKAGALERSREIGARLDFFEEELARAHKEKMKEAEEAYDDERYDDAIPLLEKVVDLAPGNVEVRLLLGTSYFQTHQTDKAMAQAEAVLARASKSARASYLKGEILFQRGKQAEARTYFERAIQYDPEMSYAHHRLGILMLDSLAQRKKGLEHVEKAVSLDEEEPLFLATLAEYRALDKDYEKAAELASRAAKLDPSNPFFKEAQKRYQEELAKHLLVVKKKEEEGRLKKEQEEAKRLSQHGYYKQYEMATPELTAKGLASAPIKQGITAVDPEALKHFFWGKAYMKQGKLDEALRSLEKAVEIAPKYVEAQQAIGETYLLQGRYELAKGHFTKLLEQAHGELDVHEGLAMVALRQGLDLDAGLREIDIALEVKPGEPRYMAIKGALLLKKGELEKGKYLLRKAAGVAPKDPLVMELSKSEEN